MAYGLVLTSIGAGLFSTMTDTTSTGKWVNHISLSTSCVSSSLQWSLSAQTGYQMIAGSGMGALYMLSFIASQVCTFPSSFLLLLLSCRKQKLTRLSLSPVAKPEDRPKASALVCFFQIWSATVSVSASEAIYGTFTLFILCAVVWSDPSSPLPANFFKNGVQKIAGVNAMEIVESGVSEFRNVVEAEYLPAVMWVSSSSPLETSCLTNTFARSYSRVAEDSLFKVFLVSAVIAAYGFVIFFLIEKKKIAKEPKKDSLEKTSDDEESTS